MGMPTRSTVLRDANKHWWAIDSEGDTARLDPDALRKGVVVLPDHPVCENCGHEIATGRANGELDSELKRRLQGKRATLDDLGVHCASCGYNYVVTDDGPFGDHDLVPKTTPKKRPRKAPSLLRKTKDLLKGAAEVITGVPFPSDARCQHCKKPIKGHPVSFHSKGKPSKHYHPHHAHHAHHAKATGG